CSSFHHKTAPATTCGHSKRLFAQCEMTNSFANCELARHARKFGHSWRVPRRDGEVLEDRLPACRIETEESRRRGFMSGRASGTGPGPRDKNPPGTRSSASPPESTPSADSTPTPTGSCPLRRVIRVINPNGLHMRLADKFIRTANQYTSSVTVWNGDA